MTAYFGILHGVSKAKDGDLFRIVDPCALAEVISDDPQKEPAPQPGDLTPSKGVAQPGSAGETLLEAHQIPCFSCPYPQDLARIAHHFHVIGSSHVALERERMQSAREHRLDAAAPFAQKDDPLVQRFRVIDFSSIEPGSQSVGKPRIPETFPRPGLDQEPRIGRRKLPGARFVNPGSRIVHALSRVARQAFPGSLIALHASIVAALRQRDAGEVLRAEALDERPVRKMGA